MWCDDKFADNMSLRPPLEYGHIFCYSLERPGVFTKRELMHCKAKKLTTTFKVVTFDQSKCTSLLKMKVFHTFYVMKKDTVRVNPLTSLQMFILVGEKVVIRYILPYFCSISNSLPVQYIIRLGPGILDSYDYSIKSYQFKGCLSTTRSKREMQTTLGRGTDRLSG